MRINLPTTMLRALKGAPLSIIVGLQIEPYATVAALVSRTGYSANSVRSGLRTLAEMRLCQSANGRTWCLTTRAHNYLLPRPSSSPAATPLPAPKSPPTHNNTSALAADTNTHDTSVAQEMQVHTPDMQVQGPNMQADAQSLQAPPALDTAITGADAQNLRKDPIDVVVVDPAEDPEQETTTTSPSLQALRDRLREAGVWSATADDLCDDPWLTQDRLDGWLDNLDEQNRRQPGSIRSVPAVLVANLRAHREPPPPRGRGRSRGRGRWAEGSGLCPVCWTRPCSCDQG
jgi:hypothetical protein